MFAARVPRERRRTLTNDIQAELSGFAKLGIDGQLLKSTLAAGFTDPKPIQVEAIPAQMEGRDILGIAQTGSGKTAAFALPTLSKIMALGTKRRPKTARALILAPTRELAVQIEDTIKLLARGAHISTALVLGGVSRSSQVRKRCSVPTKSAPSVAARSRAAARNSSERDTELREEVGLRRSA